MEITIAYIALPVVILSLVLAWILLKRSRRVRHKMTRAGLEKRATAVSDSLAAFCKEHEESQIPSLVASGGPEPPDPNERPEDLEAQALYRVYYLPEVEDLREQFARRRIREKALDRVYEAPENVTEVRTISTALVVMASRLR
jgi:hypothetical protein